MQRPDDDISVGIITLKYSHLKRVWVTPGGAVIRNPITAQNAAERLNNASKTIH